MFPTALLALAAYQLATPDPGFRRPPQAVPGDRAVKILFLRTRFADDPPTLPAYAPDFLDFVAKRLDVFFRRESYGLFSVGYTEISPVFRVAAKHDYVKSPSDDSAPSVEQHKAFEWEAIDALNEATHRKVGQTFDFICVMGRNPGVRNYAYVASKMAYFPTATKPGSFFHELGHAMGFGHSNALVSEIAGETLPPSDNRYILTYGDHSSAMGAVEIWAYSLVERYTMGWIGSDERSPRYIKRFDWGENSFVSHDSDNPRGLVGGYVEGAFGVDVSEYKRDRTKRVRVPGSENATQRLWFSLLASDGIDKGFADLPRPFILAHITGTVVAGGKGKPLQDNRTTVLLDLSPKGDDGRDLRPQSKGLFPGESARIREVDGSTVLVKFLRYEPAERRATLDIRLLPKKNLDGGERI